jgi:hypothetical protein
MNPKFRFVMYEDIDNTAIELLEDGYEGIIYHYDKVGVDESIPDKPRLKFSYTIINPGQHEVDGLHDDELFHTIMGEVCVAIILDKVDEPIRTDHIEESDL